MKTRNHAQHELFWKLELFSRELLWEREVFVKVRDQSRVSNEKLSSFECLRDDVSHCVIISCNVQGDQTGCVSSMHAKAKQTWEPASNNGSQGAELISPRHC